MARSKPASAAGSAVGGPSKLSSTLDAGPQGKRKREALGEVTGKAVNNKSKTAPESKGKGKDAATKPSKSTSSTATTRVPLRSIATRSKNIIEEPAEPIDHPKKKLAPIVEIPHANATTRGATARSNTTTSTTRKIIAHRKAPSIEEVEEEPVQKKRRTSSEVGDLPLEAIEEEFDSEAAVGPAVVEVQDWDDLDREDDDDPLMVSEYVVDIFNYLKCVEVSDSFIISSHN